MEPSRHRNYRFPPFHLEANERLLLRDGQPVPLTIKAMDVLTALVERPGSLVGRDELMRRVWPDAVVEDGNLSVTIFFLRKALGDDAEAPRFIETVPRHGYRFIAPLDDGRALPPAAVPAPPLPASRSAPPLPARRSAPATTLAVGAVLLLAALLVRPAAAPAPKPALQRRSVAVLGFKNVTGRAETAWLSNAFSEMIATELAAGQALRTIP